MIGRLTSCVILCSVFGPSLCQVSASMVVIGPQNFVGNASFPNTYATVSLTGPGVITGPSSSDLTALQNAFPNWQFNTGPALNGTLTISNFQAIATATYGRASIQASYAPGSGDPPLGNLEWIQVITTNSPLNGATSPYVDPYPNDDNLPFYWTQSEDSLYKSGGAYAFSDTPTRNYPPPPTIPQMETLISWQADLLLSSWSNPTNPQGGYTVTIYGGIQYGFRIDQYTGPVAGFGDGDDSDKNAQSVPEPPGLVIQLIGLSLLGLRSVSHRLHGTSKWESLLFLRISVALGVLLLCAICLNGATWEEGSDDLDCPNPKEEQQTKVCRLMLSVPKGSFGPTEKIPIKLVVKNISKMAITIWECGFWGNHFIEILDKNGHAPVLTELGEGRRKNFSPGGDRDKNVDILLKPGEQHDCGTGGADLGKLFRLRPGVYRARVIYHDQHSPGNMKCISNWTEFNIK